MQVGLMRADTRQEAVFKALVRRGHDVVWLIDDTHLPELIILPMPVSEDGIHFFASSEKLTDWWPRLRGKMVFGGRVSDALHRQAASYGVTLYDHFQEEEEVVLNVVPTVEGALQIAMEQTDTTLHGTSALICGYGRIGKLLAQYLKALGAKVTVAARKVRDEAWCRVHGYDYCDSRRLRDMIAGQELIFNTVPHPLFDRSVLTKMQESALLVDLASAPYGADPDLAKSLGRRVIRASSLPAKVAPRTAGEIICQTILRIYKEETTLDR